jgi:putative ABC transport system permease protein
MGLFVLAIACLNFVNIATARSLTRTTEVGIRKVVGASRKNLFRQFVGESFFSAMLALCAGVLLCGLILPTFNQFVDRPLGWGLLASPYGAICVIGLALGISLAVGIPHGLVLSSLDPVSLLKGSSRVRTRSWMRQALVGIQFALSILLVLITFAMSDQMDFIRNKNLGYNPEQIVTTPIFRVDWQMNKGSTTDLLSWDSEKAEQAFLAHPNVLSAASYRYSMGMPNKRRAGPLWRTLRGPHGRQIQMPMQEVDDDFLATFKIRLQAGRNFNPLSEADFGESIILNEAAVKAFELENPIGVQFGQLMGDGSYAPRTSIGVVEDFHLL